MSRLSAERLDIWLAPRELRVTRRTGRFFRRRSERTEIALSVSPAETPWDAGTGALRTYLREREIAAAALDVVLSSRFARFELIAPHDGVCSNEERVELARHRFVSVYGPGADRWLVHLSHQGEGAPFIAAAIDPLLLEALRGANEGGRILLRSVKPCFSEAFDRARARIEGGDWWLAVNEPGALTVACVRQGRWCAIRSRRVASDWREDLHGLIEREAVLAGLDVRPTRLYLVEGCTHQVVRRELETSLA